MRADACRKGTRVARATSRTAVCIAILLAAASALVLSASAQDEPPHVNAGTQSDVELRAPRRDDAITFVVFGDRTAGMAMGVRILERAVETANRLDPDFVMTVGDLVEGYTGPAKWLAEANEYKAAMSKLRAPWYPVAGNHDVYGGEKRPEGNCDLFRKHFGPLWYSFDCGWVHVVALFSDESLSFSDPEKDQNFSEEQLAWLEADLAATKAEQVFVFLHHPRWLYDGTNWSRAHELLVKDGRCRAVFAGHLHTYRYDGLRDGIHHVTLAMTGATARSLLTDTSAVHHVAHVRARRDRFTLALLPVGAESGIDRVLGAELDAMNELARGEWLGVEGVPRIGTDAGRGSVVNLAIRNPTDRALEWQATIKVPEGWKAEPAKLSGKAPPLEIVRTPVRFTAPAWDAAGRRPDVAVEATVAYVTASGLRQPIRASLDVPVKSAPVKGTTAARPLANQVLALDGESAVRVPLAAAATALDRFTAECWARSRGPAKSMAVFGRSESSSFVMFWSPLRRNRTAPTAEVYVRRLPGTKRAGYAWAGASEAIPPERWTHLAMVVDAGKLRFFIDGRRVDEADAPGPPTTNSLPFLIGAQPEKGGRVLDGFVGEIDEFRLSSAARYESDFKPARFHRRDEETVLLFHFDAVEDGLFLDDSGNEDHGWPAGAPQLTPPSR